MKIEFAAQFQIVAFEEIALVFPGNSEHGLLGDAGH
jgi:hypothetical protein